jgi:hypothetical protein
LISVLGSLISSLGSWVGSYIVVSSSGRPSFILSHWAGLQCYLPF